MVLSKPVHVERDLPPVDERLVEPESRYEMYDGELVHVSPANPRHADRHANVTGLLLAHARSEFCVSVDLLIRTSRTSDIAPDVSVRPRGRDPRTGGRRLEQLAFEIVSTQSLRGAGRKAAMLAARGVRRVFAIDVKRRRVLEWSSSEGSWQPLELRSYIDDPVFAGPLPVKPLVRAARSDDAVARALLLKNNPVIEARMSRGLREGKRKGLAEGKRKGLAEGKRKGLAEGKRKGLAEGKRKGLAEGKRKGLAEGKRKGLAEGKRKGLAEALLAMLAGKGMSLDRKARARIRDERDARRVKRWFARALRCTSIAAVLQPS